MRNLCIKRMNKETIGDFSELLSKPPEGWCWCVAWEVATWDGWGDRSAEENRTLRETLWKNGSYHGYLFYMDDAPIGWCRVGPTQTWPKLCATRKVEPASGLYCFTCFGMKPEYRRRGFLGELFSMMIADLESLGVGELVAFPKNIDGTVPDGEIWNGPRSVFLENGFRVVRVENEYSELRRSRDVRIPR